MFKLFNKKQAISCCATATGDVYLIEKSEDPVFAQKMLGDGFFIKPQTNEIVSPIDGEIIMMFPTNHALGIKDNSGNEYLLHIGIDTVSLNGEGFTPFVSVNERVVAGQKLMEVDLNLLLSNSIKTDVILISTDGQVCEINAENANAGQLSVAKFSK